MANQLTAGGSPVYRDSAGHLFDGQASGSTAQAAASTPAITSTYSMPSAADGMNPTLVATGPVTLLTVDAYNARTGGVSIALYDKAAAPVIGTDTPKWTVYLPATTPIGRNWDAGLRFTNGLAFALIPDDASGLMAGDVTGLNMGYSA